MLAHRTARGCAVKVVGDFNVDLGLRGVVPGYGAEPSDVDQGSWRSVALARTKRGQVCSSRRGQSFERFGALWSFFERFWIGAPSHWSEANTLTSSSATSSLEPRSYGHTRHATRDEAEWLQDDMLLHDVSASLGSARAHARPRRPEREVVAGTGPGSTPTLPHKLSLERRSVLDSSQRDAQLSVRTCVLHMDCCGSECCWR